MIWAWGGFLAFVAVVLAIDLGVFNREPRVVAIREALLFAGGVIAMALAFSLVTHVAYDQHWFGLGRAIDPVDKLVNDGRLAAVKFLTGYVVELSLSMDNVFVIALIFEHLRVPPKYQHRVLFWGILGALAMRGVMILAGAGLVARYHWVLYGFGVFLIVTAVRMLVGREPAEREQETEARVVRWLRRFFPVTERYHDSRFVVELNGRRFLTPLAVALVLVETTDLVFAVDSIPAIFAITADPFLVFTSNVFAILCLRSLYFGLAGLIERFQYLKQSLALVLGIVGAKMLAGEWLREHLGPAVNYWLLGLIALVLAGGAGWSVAAGRGGEHTGSTR